ncbi:RING-H2 finger protein ATL56-like [Zingiber officinale]|uniref:RING-type domain-containing protein n=1 Tax=Zingiber officinale TaxID=94328 RepID=A0A8J5GJM2_ZINOF|nr:RING-H2 finger protein ATL56-like [Zingiber officinale]XP_042391459.1 RING-H2 finger protein ATL56-like [Zingiber officinale]KAG6509186.1 hypothetical protein ZIOFF_034577 [Zingiber officinale]
MAGIDRRPPSLASADSPSTMRHSSSSDASAVAKPKCGVRFLFFFFRAVFMAAALAIFFVFAGLAAVVLLLVAVGAVRGRERRSVASDDGGGGALRGLSPAQLSGLPWFEFPGVASSRLWTTPDCSVCLVKFKRGERCRSLPSCGHVFHAGCVDQWLVRSPGCPICRSIVSEMGPEPADF